jgi:hypothetical protein
VTGFKGSSVVGESEPPPPHATRDKIEIKVIAVLNPTRLNGTEMKVKHFD